MLHFTLRVPWLRWDAGTALGRHSRRPSFPLFPFPCHFPGTPLGRRWDGTCKPCKSLGKDGLGTLGRQNLPPLCTRAFHSMCSILRSAFPGSVGTPGRHWDATVAVPVFPYPLCLVTFPGRPRDGAGTAPANDADLSVNTALGRWDGKIHHLCAHAFSALPVPSCAHLRHPWLNRSLTLTNSW